MRILVTGTAGFLGPAAIEVLGRDHWQRDVDIRPSPAPLSGETMLGDLASYAFAAAAVEGVEAIVHLAIAGQPSDYESTEIPMKGTVVATANLLEAARRAGIQRFVLMSSGAVVTGYSRDTYIHIGLPHNFRGLYCLTNSLQEILAKQYAEEYGLTLPALRPWSVVDGRTYHHKNGQYLSYSLPP